MARSLIWAFMLAVVAAGTLDAQIRRGRQGAGPTWAPIAIGVRGGYDQNARGEVLGAFLRLPILRNGVLELMPSADLVFVTGARERQYGLELVYVTGGRQGGLYAGGGVGWRDTVINATSTEPRSNLLAYSLVVGATSGPAARLRTQLELRWIFLEGTTFRPIPVTLGVSLPLWRAAPSG